jgi:hypothetical protein
MRLTSSHPRRANRSAMPASKPPHPMLRVIIDAFIALSGRRERDAERAREQFEGLDVDQRVRKLGEW